MTVPIRFTVSQVRVAAACPRILYFDQERTRSRKLKQPHVTRIWKKDSQGNTSTALGTLFHRAVERFNSQAAKSDDVRRILESSQDVGSLANELHRFIYLDYVDLDRLYTADGAQQKCFMEALACYTRELADVLTYGRNEGMPADELLDQLFADQRRKVDVTFRVGPDDTAVNVSGVLDYLFFDWRSGRRRIIDYKLTPGGQPSMDLHQVCVYALMHHVQHQTEPDVGVLYLHPRREMKEMAWEDVYARRHVIYDLLASMAAWVQYEEEAQQGLKPPGEPLYCTNCPWNKTCAKRLGPIHEGGSLTHWRDKEDGQKACEPQREVHEIPERTRSSATADRSRRERGGTLEIGTFADNRFEVTLPVSALPRHVAVVGASGSGKTYLAKVLVEEAIRQKIPVLAIDPQGDLVQFLKPANGGRDPARPSFDEYWQTAQPRVLTPGSSLGIRVRLNPLRLPAEEDLKKIGDPARRQEELTGMVAATAANLVTMAKVGGDSELQQTFLMQLLRKLIARPDSQQLDLEEIASAACDPTTVGMEDADDFLPATQRRKLGQKFKALLHGPYANLFQGGEPLDLDQLCRATDERKTPLNVVYLNALTNEEQKLTFLSALATEIYRWMFTTSREKGAVKLLFYVDEARTYVPAGSQKPVTKEPIKRLFQQGRSHGVACLMCTQSPRSVDYHVFGNCSTKLIGRLESTQDVDRVAEWFSTEGARPDWLSDRKRAEAGTFVGRWPDMPRSDEGRTFKSRSLYSLHEGAWTPDRIAQEMDRRCALATASAGI